jgi:nitrogen fixation NifU-like protein
MTDALHDLYQHVILDHNRHPRNFRAVDGAATAEGYNRMCGDRVTVYVRVDAGVIADVGFQGSGCAISRASASLMTESVRDQTVADAAALIDRLRQTLLSPPGSAVDHLGTLAPLAGVRQFPIRIKCATLAWDALRAALAGQLTRR